MLLLDLPLVDLRIVWDTDFCILLDFRVLFAVLANVITSQAPMIIKKYKEALKGRYEYSHKDLGISSGILMLFSQSSLFQRLKLMHSRIMGRNGAYIIIILLVILVILVIIFLIRQVPITPQVIITSPGPAVSPSPTITPTPQEASPSPL